MILIVAKYNHEELDSLDQQVSALDSSDFILPKLSGTGHTLRHEARDIAVKVFGVSASLYPQLSENIPPEQPLKNLFTFLDAFKYPILQEGEQLDPINDAPFGWVALVTDDQLSRLKNKMGHPDSHYCKVFDFQFIPLNDDFTGAWENIALSDDDWKLLGQKVYEHQTPASWKD